MTLLIVYVLVALVFSFLCSIAEAVLLSVSPAYVALLEERGRKSGQVLRRLTDNIQQPLAAILTLNTIAHTIGAAGAGAQAAQVFGNDYLGLASGILTLLILVLSEIIPKTIGAVYWRQLAPATAFGLRLLVKLLFPFVKLSELITGGITEGPMLSGFSRREFVALVNKSAEEGEIGNLESQVVRNTLALSTTPVSAVMTPRTVVFSLPEDITVDEYMHRHGQNRFSRIPVYQGEPDNVTGFVLRSDLLLARARGNQAKPLENYRRDMPSMPETLNLIRAFRTLLRNKDHMALVVDEYGDMQGIITQEDIIESLLGLEIVDESDEAVDMRKVARRKWLRRARRLGVAVDEDGDGTN